MCLHGFTLGDGLRALRSAVLILTVTVFYIKHIPKVQTGKSTLLELASIRPSPREKLQRRWWVRDTPITLHHFVSRDLNSEAVMWWLFDSPWEKALACAQMREKQRNAQNALQFVCTMGRPSVAVAEIEMSVSKPSSLIAVQPTNLFSSLFSF